MIMPFLRLVLIYVAVAAAAVVFFNRDSVLPMVGWPWFGSESSEVAISDTPAAYPDAVAVEDTETAPAPAPQAVIDEEPQEKAPTETASTQPLQQPVAEPSPPTAEPAAQPAPAKPAPAAAVQPAPAAPATATDKPQTTAQSASDLEAQRNEARQAYWNGDRAKTERLYKAMAAANPENVDILGELGNLYFSQRRYDEAATYYHMAAKQLISDGQTPKAMGLINVLQSIAPAKASELRALAAAKP